MEKIDVYAAALLSRMLRLNSSGLPLENDGEIDAKIALALKVAARCVALSEEPAPKPKKSK